ncbi:hypothetical protein D3C81_499000 [compost metagenome]
MNDLAQFLDAFFKHAMRGRVGDHHAGQVGAVLFRFRLQVGQVHVAVGVAAGDDHLHADHVGRCGVGAVRRRGNQADVAVAFAARFVIRLDYQQASVFALRAGVRLQRDGGVARQRAQHFFQLRDHFAVADRLRIRRERVDVRELGPGHGDHFRRGVQLHGAGTERDHGAVQRQVLVGQAAQVAQHFVFRVVAVEDRVRQIRAFTRQIRRQRAGHGRFNGVQLRKGGRVGQAFGEHGPQQRDIVARGGFVERQADMGGIDLTQVDAVLDGRRVQFVRIGDVDGQGVEVAGVGDAVAQGLQVGRQHARKAVHALGDLQQAGRAVVDGVHRRHHGQQHLRRADVGRRFFAADMLFARLQGQAVRLVALRIDGHADQAARHIALELIARGQIARVRAAETERHAEALAVADDDVGAPFARWREHGQGQQVGRDDDHGAIRMQFFHAGAVVAHDAVDARVLQQHAEAGVQRLNLRRVEGTHVDADRLGARLHHFQGLRQHVAGHIQHVRLRLAHALDQGHRFGGGRAFVQHRGIRDAHAGQVGDDLLEVQNRFQATLRNLWLVRRVRRVPGRVFKDVAQHDARGEGVVVALADQGFEHLVLAGDGFQARQRFLFRHRLRVRAQRQGALVADVGRYQGIDQRGARWIAEGREHGLLFGVGRADVAGDEGIACFELGQAGAGHDIEAKKD